VCNRALKNPQHAAEGIGPVCKKKAGFEVRLKVEDEQPVLTDAGNIKEVGLICRRLESGRLACNIPQIYAHHSPTGFECGYGGSGPADLALNVMAIFCPGKGVKLWDGQQVSHDAWGLHQKFKFKFIGGMNRAGGNVTLEEILAFINHERAEAAA
jgi:hypothetical protein